jgi:tetratricopeptide (TPR) repeat protein
MQSTAVSRAKVKWSAAEALAANGKLDEAEKTLLEAKRLVEEQEQEGEIDQVLLPNILSSLSLIQKKLNRHEKVLSTLKTLLKQIIEKRLSKLDHAITLGNIGTTLFFLGKLDVSLTYTLKANKMMERIASPENLAQAASDIEHGYWVTMTLDERKKLLHAQVPACYNLAIIYHHLGCALESGRCLNAAKSLAISKIGFNHKVTDLVTKNAELKSKEGNPVFLTLRFHERSSTLVPANERSRLHLADPDRDPNRAPMMAGPKSKGNAPLNEFLSYKHPTSDDGNPRMPLYKVDHETQKLPLLKQERPRNPILRPGAGPVPKTFQGARPQTDNNDWNPSYNANYPAIGMQRVIFSGRPLSNGETVGVRVTKLPSLHEKAYLMAPESRSYDVETSFTGAAQPRHLSNREPIDYDILRIESSKSNLPERDVSINQKGAFDFGLLKKSHLMKSGVKLASVSEEPKPRNYDPYTNLSRNLSQDKHSANFSKPKELTKSPPNPVPPKKKELQPMLQLSHFGFNEEEPPAHDRSRFRESHGDSPNQSKHLQSGPALMEEAFSTKYKPGGSMKRAEEVPQSRNLDIGRLQINMRYLG